MNRVDSDSVGALSYCVKERKPCVGWVDKYFKDCLCNVKDDFSFGFGMVSLICWGVAEIPQIITNFRTKSSHGVSLLFLLTWIVGDIFNLTGCILEPATLPTQYYTAVLYTASTIVLVLQSIYYDHFYKWWKCRKRDQRNQGADQERKCLKPRRPDDGSGITVPVGITAQRSQTEYYYTSARSLARSSTPPTWSYLRVAKSGPSAMGLVYDSSSDGEPVDQDEPQIPNRPSTTQPKPIPRSAGVGAFFATAISLPNGSKALMQVYVGLQGRKLLNQAHGIEENVYGVWLGWLMAAIYMGGRIPQIWLNIKRGSVEGLNPLMFVFALIANVAYVASILVRTTKWNKIKPNMPWLLDAAVCVALDVLIILQYIYYRYYKERRSGGNRGEDYGDYYIEADKGPLL